VPQPHTLDDFCGDLAYDVCEDCDDECDKKGLHHGTSWLLCGMIQWPGRFSFAAPRGRPVFGYRGGDKPPKLKSPEYALYLFLFFCVFHGWLSLCKV